MGAGATVTLHLQTACRFFALPFREGRLPSLSFWGNIGRCISIAVITLLCPAISTSCSFSSLTSAQLFLISYRVFYIAACQNLPLAIWAVFSGTQMSDSFSCTRHPCLAIVVDILKTYKKFVATCYNEIRLVPQLYMVLYRAVRRVEPVSSNPGDAYHKIHLQLFQMWQHHDIQFGRQCGQMPS